MVRKMGRENTFLYRMKRPFIVFKNRRDLVKERLIEVSVSKTPNVLAGRYYHEDHSSRKFESSFIAKALVGAISTTKKDHNQVVWVSQLSQ